MRYLPNHRNHRPFQLPIHLRTALNEARQYAHNPRISALVAEYDYYIPEIAAVDHAYINVLHQINNPPFWVPWVEAPSIWFFPTVAASGYLIGYVDANPAGAFQTGSSAISLAHSAQGLMSPSTGGGVPTIRPRQA